MHAPLDMGPQPEPYSPPVYEVGHARQDRWVTRQELSRVHRNVDGAVEVLVVDWRLTGATDAQTHTRVGNQASWACCDAGSAMEVLALACRLRHATHFFAYDT
jgi:hypothetical protein